MAKHPDVAIVGGGIIGLTCAFFLAKEGLTVEVFDRGELGKEASWAGAGIIPPGNAEKAATPIDRLRAIGSIRFPGFSDELRDLTGIENGYLRCGGIEFLAADEVGDVVELWTNERIAFELLSRSALHEVEPAIEGIPAEPYLLPDCAQVRNPRHLCALIAAGEHVGVRFHPHSAVQFIERDSKRNTHANGLALSGATIRAGRILITAGPWSETFVSTNQQNAPAIHPVRGQIVLLKAPDRLITHVLMFGKQYLVPRADNRVLIGSTEEPEAGFEKANTVEGIAELLLFATRLVPGLATAERERCWSGLRPGTSDGLPFIGPVPGWDNVFVAAGHFRAGVQLSIGTAQAITELFTDKPTCVPLEAFAVGRSPASTGKPSFRS